MPSTHVRLYHKVNSLLCAFSGIAESFHTCYNSLPAYSPIPSCIEALVLSQQQVGMNELFLLFKQISHLLVVPVA